MNAYRTYINSLWSHSFNISLKLVLVAQDYNYTSKPWGFKEAMPSRKIVDGWGFNCLGYKVDANDQVTLLNRVEYICTRFLKNRKDAHYDFARNTLA